ncbi:hypothetical protein M3Y99_00576800 [Aphelenchoides fujianensis]|nr:hypothetical protein M3Y99_00576800 [Aphelenchoides fujianensis]
MELSQMLQLSDAQIDALDERALVAAHFELGEYVRANRQYAALNKQLVASIGEDCRSMAAERAVGRQLASSATGDLRAVRADGAAVGEFLGGFDAQTAALDTTAVSADLLAFERQLGDLQDEFDRFRLDLEQPAAGDEEAALLEEEKRVDEEIRELDAAAALEVQLEPVELRSETEIPAPKLPAAAESELPPAQPLSEPSARLIEEPAAAAQNEPPPEVPARPKSPPKKAEKPAERRATQQPPVQTATPLAARPPKPRKKRWGRGEKADFETAFRLFNPLSEADWRQVADVLPVERTVAELEAQAARMRLRPQRPKERAESTELVGRLKRLMAGGRLPPKGTERREELEETVGLLWLRRPDGGALDETLEDSDSEFFREAIREHALDVSLPRASAQPPPSRRAFAPPPIRSPELVEVGDDFSIPPASQKRQQFRRRFRAAQFKRQTGDRKAKAAAEDTSADDTDDLDEI